MAVELATGYVSLIPSAEGFAEKLGEELDLDTIAAAQGKSAGEKLQSSLLGSNVDTGKKLATALGLAAVAAIATKSAIDIEDAQNTIIRSTGATGKAADGLEQSFRNVASGSAASFDVISKTLSELYQRTGLQGKALEGLTSQVVTFNRITKDSPITVDSLTKALAGFNVPAKDMGVELDHLFTISQKTGVPLAELLGTMQTAGPIARQFGFSLDFTAGFLAQLNKAGVDANSILPGLKRVFTDAAKAGKDPADALREIVGQLDALVKAGDIIGAKSLAAQVFGARGVGLVDAAVAGKLSLEALNQTFDVTGDGISKTASKTGTLSGAMGVLRNNVQLALAGFVTPALEVANEELRGILPTVQSLSKDFADLPDPIKLGAAAAVGLAFSLGKIGTFVTNAGPGLKALGEAAATGFQLAAVRGLELIEVVQGLSAAQLLAGGGLGLLAVAVVGLSLALSSSSNEFTRAEAAAKSWSTTTVAGAKASGNEVGTLNGTLVALKARLRDLSPAGVDLNDKLVLIQASSGELGSENQKLARQYIDVKARIDALTPSLDKAKDAQKQQAAANNETKRSLDTYNTAVTTGGDATSAFANLTDAAKKAVQDFQSTLLAASGGEIGYQQSLANGQKAQDDLTAAIIFTGDGSKETAAAALALKEAQLQAASAAQKLDTDNNTLVAGIRDGTISYDAQKAALLDQIRLHPEAAAGIQLEIDKLEAARFWAVVLDATDPTVTVTTPGGAEALQMLRDLRDAAIAFPAVGIGIFGIPQIVGHAAEGGDIAPGAWSWVGEKGPELVRNAGPAPVTVIPHIDSVAMMNSVQAPPSAAPGDGGAPLIGQWHQHSDPPNPIRDAITAAKTLRVAAAVGV